MEATAAQDRRLAAIASAAAETLRTTEYHKIRAEDVAARVRVEGAVDRRSGSGGRSVVWLYNEVRSRRVLVALGARHAWNEYEARVVGGQPPTQPVTLLEGVSAVASSVERIVGFHRVENFLIAQVAYGIGDIATSEKRRRAVEAEAAMARWPESCWGRLAEAAYDGRYVVYADHLAPTLHAAANSVAPMSEETAREQACSLSDLIFRGLTSDPYGPAEQVAAGFAAYWFERGLVSAAGRWVRELYAADLAFAAALKTSDRRAVQSAHSASIRVLMEADTLHERCAREGAARTAALAEDLGWPCEPSSARMGAARLSDFRALCDSASRLGLARYRYGDIDAAIEAFRLSRDVAVGAIAAFDEREGKSFAARADHNLADVALDLEDYREAGARCDRALTARAELLESVTDDAVQDAAAERAAAFRRYMLTAELHALMTARLGRPVEATRLALRLLGSTAVEQGGSDEAMTARLRGTLAEILAEAGQPLEAQHHLEAVHRLYNARTADVSISWHEYRNRLRLVRILLRLGELDRALDLLPDSATVEWCGAHVTRVGAAQARRLRALGLSAAGRHEEAEEEIAGALEQLRRSNAYTVPDIRLAPLEQTRAIVLMRSGRAETGLDVLRDVLSVRRAASGAGFAVTQAETLMWLARAADATGHARWAVDYHRELSVAAAETLEPRHPVLLEAGLDQAARLVHAGDFEYAVSLIEPVLDRTPLEHGRPALEAGHPLVDAARALADSLGMRIATHEPRWDED
jgi:hypothetical protein